MKAAFTGYGTFGFEGSGMNIFSEGCHDPIRIKNMTV
jgi:hypothetical protein